MEKEINKLTPAEISEILYLSKQGNYGRINRVRLVCNLYSISREQLVEIVNNYSDSPIFVDNSISDYS